MNAIQHPEKAQVFVVDDDLSVREAMSSLIRSVGLGVDTFASAAEFLSRFRRPDTAACLVLDVRMPGMSGLELQRHLGETGHHLPIVFITGHGDIPMTVRAIKAGAIEFLPKPFRDQDLLEAITQSLQQDEAAQATRLRLAELRARLASLTPRELEVLPMMLKGLRNKQAAHALGIAEVTVKVHRHHIMEKMQASSVPDLVEMINTLRQGESATRTSDLSGPGSEALGAGRRVH